MNIKKISLLTVLLIASFANVHANRTVKNLDQIKTELKIAEQEWKKELIIAQEHPLWSPLIQAENKCLKKGNCRRCEAYQAISTEWLATDAGQNLRRAHMKKLGLDKIKRYIEYGSGPDPVDRAISAIHSALYIDMSMHTNLPHIRDIQKEVAQELCGLIESPDVTSEEIHQKLQAKINQ